MGNLSCYYAENRQFDSLFGWPLSGALRLQKVGPNETVAANPLLKVAALSLWNGEGMLRCDYATSSPNDEVVSASSGWFKTASMKGHVTVWGKICGPQREERRCNLKTRLLFH